ncbi:hypothetical protein A2U01_0112579 [Trifolium medium]|uniref:Uncharacterized protein n=1 Tax=Trifolium medium TaxID=97028 RepID=A0A392VX74_9FABA|nr:hypothetical protein [Trifolium medium]
MLARCTALLMPFARCAGIPARFAAFPRVAQRSADL